MTLLSFLGEDGFRTSGEVGSLQPGDPLPGYTPWGYRPDPAILDQTSPTRRIAEQGLIAAVPGDVVPYVFGRTLVEPTVLTVIKKASGGLYIDYMLSTGICEEIDAVVQAGVTTDISAPISGWEHYLGTASQVSSPVINAELGGSPGPYDTLNGICHVVADITKSSSMDVKFILKGLRLWDPRLSPAGLTTTASSNPALALARVFTDCGYTVDWDSVGVAATYCDESTGSPQLARWTVDLPIFNRSSLDKWAHTLAQYCGGLHIDIRGGTVFLIVDSKVTTSPQITHTVTADDIQAPRTTRLGSRQVPGKVIVHYREADGTTGYAPIGTGSSGHISRLRMPGFNNYSMAARFATQTLAKSQSDRVHEHTAFDAALSPTVGELADVTYAPHGLASERMRLVGYQQTSIGLWRRKYVQYSDSQYSDATFTAPTPGVKPDLDTPCDVPAGPTPTITEVTYTAGGYNRIKVTFTESTWAHVLDYLVVVSPSGGDQYGDQTVLVASLPHTGSGTQTVYTGPVIVEDLVSSPVVAAVEYKAYVYIRSSCKYGTAGTALLSPGVVPTSITDGLAAWYKLDETSGTRFNSHVTASPNPYDLLEDVSVGSAAGKISNAAVFPGRPSPIGGILYTTDSGSPVSADLMTATTICGCCWVNAAELPTPTNSACIIRRGEYEPGFGLGPVEWYLTLYYDNSTSPVKIRSRIAFQAAAPDTVNTAAMAIDTEVLIDTWYFIYWQWDASENKGAISQNDGTLYKTNSNGNDIGASGGTIMLGDYYHSTDPGLQVYRLDGAVDEVGLWHGRVLSATDITNLYNAGAGVTYADLTWSS